MGVIGKVRESHIGIVHIACTLEGHSSESTEETPLRATEGARSASKTDVPQYSQNGPMKTKTSTAEAEQGRPQHLLAAAEAGVEVASSAREAADDRRPASAGMGAGGAMDGRHEGAEVHERGGVSAAEEGQLSAVHTERV